MGSILQRQCWKKLIEGFSHPQYLGLLILLVNFSLYALDSNDILDHAVNLQGYDSTNSAQQENNGNIILNKVEQTAKNSPALQPIKKTGKK